MQPQPTRSRSVSIAVEGTALDGDLAIPRDARGVVAFAHGSGSGRFSPRNRFVAGVLQRGGLATLLLDLLTLDEERIDAYTAHLRLDIELLARRFTAAVDWLAREPETQHLRIGCFGASTGAAAALYAAAARPARVAAVVSRGGRPDLAAAVLHRVRAPTLLIVGGADYPVIQMNREAFGLLRASKHMEIVPGAAHLFEEPGTLDRVAELARDWFVQHLAGHEQRPHA